MIRTAALISATTAIVIHVHERTAGLIPTPFEHLPMENPGTFARGFCLGQMLVARADEVIG